MHPNNEQPGGVTCDHWYLGIYCDCLDCKVLMEDALHLNITPFAGQALHQQASVFSPVEQNLPVDPLLLNNQPPMPSLTLPPEKNNNFFAKAPGGFQAQKQYESLYNPLLTDPTKDDLNNALGLGSPYQGSQPLPAQKRQPAKHQYPDPSSFSMLPMPQLFSPDPDFNNHSENAANIRGLNRQRASSFATDASSPPGLYSPNLYGTPGATPQANVSNTPINHQSSPEFIENAMASRKNPHQQQPSTRRLRSHTDQTTTNSKRNVLHGSPLSLPSPSLPSASPELSTSALSPSQDPETAAIMAQQKPKPLFITPDMSDTEKARLCEQNDTIFAERLRIQRAKNNCAAKKSRQRRLDLIKDLQAENSQQRLIIEELSVERGGLKGQIDGYQIQMAELQANNAELLREKVEAQREVMGAASLRSERDGLREDLRHQQQMVQSLMMRLTAGGSGGGGGGGSHSTVPAASVAASTNNF